MTSIVPLLPTPSQTVSVRLGPQQCRLHVYQTSAGLFLDLYNGDALVIGGVAARNGVRVVQDTYFGFVGDLAFADTEGEDDPSYEGLGTRWVLAYLTP